MALPLSKSQIERLGRRLVDEPEPPPAAVTALHRLLEGYGVVLDATVDRVVADIDVSPTSRVKSTGTILEKLRRQGGSWLKSMQDIAGMRIVGELDWAGQDQLVNQLTALFASDGRAPKVIDRRTRPMHGYRAVHAIVFPEAVPVEIQVRTRLQHEWANMFEKLSDRAGRDIRYGGPPDHWLPADQRGAASSLQLELYNLAYEVRTATVASALALADLVAAVEAAENVDPEAPELPEYRKRVVDGLTDLRSEIAGWS